MCRYNYKKKIKKIYTNSKDFDDRVKGKTKKILNQKKIKIIYKKNQSSSSLIHNISSKRKIPYVVSKIAISKDGFTKHKKKNFLPVLMLLNLHICKDISQILF